MNSEKENLSISFVELIRITPALLSLIAGCALGASVIYDWGYFDAIGLSFADMPVSLVDHTESALLWLPIFIIGILGALILNLVVVRLDRGITAEERIQRSRFPRLTHFFEDGWIRLLRIASVVAILVYLFFPYGRLDQLRIPLFIAWVVFSEWILLHGGVRKRLPLGFMLFVLTFGIILIELGLTGRGDAFDSLHDEKNVATITLASSGTQLKDVHVIRTFSSGILVFDEKDNLIRLVGSQQIGLIDWKYRSDTFNGLIMPKLNISK